MFEHTSRYYAVTEAKYVAPGGREIIYKRRRFLPQAEAMPLIVNITLEDSERLDLITARTLGDPELFWRICDANNAMNPFQLTDQPGRTLRVSTSQV